MTNKNDERILELKKQIKAEKEQLGKATRFTPNTNCIIEIGGQRLNINVLQKEQLIYLMVKINAYAMSAKDLRLDGLIISGYSVEEWIGDIKSKLDIISRKAEEQKLKQMESKLEKLLSEDKKVELEINEIEDLLK